MSEIDTVETTLSEPKLLSRREQRAARTRAGVLSPFRAVRYLLYVPVLTVVIALSVYLRTSPYDPPEAVMHLAAMAGCDAAALVGLAPAHRGSVGYHLRNDLDRDGVACEARDGLGIATRHTAEVAGPAAKPEAPVRVLGGAKFVRP